MGFPLGIPRDSHWEFSLFYFQYSFWSFLMVTSIQYLGLIWIRLNISKLGQSLFFVYKSFDYDKFFFANFFRRVRLFCWRKHPMIDLSWREYDADSDLTLRCRAILSFMRVKIFFLNFIDIHVCPEERDHASKKKDHGTCWVRLRQVWWKHLPETRHNTRDANPASPITFIIHRDYQQ